MTPTPRRLLLLLLFLLVLAVGGAAVSDGGGIDSALSAVAGAVSVLLLACSLLLWTDRRDRRTGDFAALDRLEPLRAARRDDA